ncbi:MAG: hypothetical protein AAGL98_12105, partial [Planctomycetota bacterium]
MVNRGLGWTGLGLGLGLLSVVVTSAGADPAGDWIGAEAAILQWAADSDSVAASPETPADPLRDDIERFAEQWPTFSADAAAEDWLVLYDRWVESMKQTGVGVGFYGPGDETDTVQLTDVVASIPGPEVWPTLNDRVLARSDDAADRAMPERALRMFVFYLNGDHDAFAAEAGVAVSRAEKIDPYVGTNFLQSVAPLLAIES